MKGSCNCSAAGAAMAKTDENRKALNREAGMSATSAAIGIVEQLAIGGVQDQIIVRVLGSARLVDA